MSTRIERLSQEFQQEIATILQRDLKDPGAIGFVTITRVELSKDVSHAKVFFSCLGGAPERAKAQEGLERAAYFIRGLLMKRFRLKVIPELQFRFDESIEQSIQMSDVFDRIKKQDGA